MPVDSNFSYDTLYDFHSNFDISEWLSFKQAFPLPHFNIRSLSGNFEDFTTMLTKLYIPFSVIGLSETKIKFGEQPLINIDLPGYTFVSQNTLSNAGGVGFYVRNDLTFTVLSELSCTTADYEALWIEIQKRHGHNIICGVIYRHPNDNLDSVLEYLNSTAERIDQGSKYCAVLGDFKVDLLKIEKHQPTDDFLNTMSSFCFQPQILQPTRIQIIQLHLLVIYFLIHWSILQSVVM